MENNSMSKNTEEKPNHEDFPTEEEGRVGRERAGFNEPNTSKNTEEKPNHEDFPTGGEGRVGRERAGFNRFPTGMKYSIGIACCRRRTEKDPLEILLVQRRTTYAFAEIVLGRYKLKNLSKIKYLIKNMTANEQSELITKNFEVLWWMVMRQKKEDSGEFYLAKEAKFNTAFNIMYDLAKLINQSTSILSYWEIPKGRHNSKKETDLNCAVREFEEETGISIDMYKIIFDPIVYSYQENNYTYVIKYYPAKCHYLPHSGRLTPAQGGQLLEVIAIRWMDMNMIRTLGDKRLTTLVGRIFETF